MKNDKFYVEKGHILGYNKKQIRKLNILKCARPLLFLNLHRLQRESKIAAWMSGRHYAAEDRIAVEDTHLATARRQWEGNGISGLKKKDRACKRLFFCDFPKKYW